jgi:phosphoadenosine phosphosulfate reductase|nr:MAG TPA: phosphoadenosine-phosphosulfate reductase [Caudoviricetes sp.]
MSRYDFIVGIDPDVDRSGVCLLNVVDREVTVDSLTFPELLDRLTGFKAYFNHSFESSVTLKFIKEYYPEVIYKFGFIENIWKNHNGMLPTVSSAYCCADYKHNPKYQDKCTILGIRKSESSKRAKYSTVSMKNKALINEYFEEHCQSTGSPNVLQLKPIIDWTNEDVWNYIKAHDLPVNPEYKEYKRVGCLVCPKANFTSNYKTLLKYPKLIDAFIRARSNNTQDWIITSDNLTYEDDKPYYICRWLNHSFMPFTKKQEALYKQVREAYDILHESK